MAKASTKKPKLTPEEQMAELARLTGSVAAISHMGTSQPFVLPGAAPAPEAAAAPTTPAAAIAEAPAPEPVAPVAVAPLVPAAQPEPPVTTIPIAVAKPAAQQAAPLGPVVSDILPKPKEEKVPVAPVTAAPGPPVTAAEIPVEDGQDEEDAEEVPAAAPAESKDKLDFTSLFADSAEKKTFQIRITASHQQFFQQMGLLLGGGASSTDVIHNILAQFKAANEVQIQKAFQRQLRQMMSPKK